MKTPILALVGLMSALTTAYAAPEPFTSAAPPVHSQAVGRHTLEIVSGGAVVATVDIQDGIQAQMHFESSQAHFSNGLCILSGHVTITIAKPGQPPVNITAEEVRFKVGTHNEML